MAVAEVPRERERVGLREVSPPAVTVGNPAPLGLLAFGMTTALFSLTNAKAFGVGTMILAMAALFGGFAQMLAALMAFRRNDTFGLTAFGGYSFLWITLSFLLIGQEHGWWPVANSTTAMGWYLLVWSVFGLGVCIGSLTHPRALTGVLVLTAALVLVLATAEWTGNDTVRKVGGWEGIATGASAVYVAFAFLLRESFGRTILPVGRPLVRPALG